MDTLRAPHFTRTHRLGLGGAALLTLGIAAGGGAVSLTRPPVEMAPTVSTAISGLSSTRGIVSVRGRVAAIYGDRFLLQDRTGRTLVDAGHDRDVSLSVGSSVLVQGRFGDGQLHARFLVDAAGTANEVGPPPPHGGPGGPPPPPIAAEQPSAKTAAPDGTIVASPMAEPGAPVAGGPVPSEATAGR